MFAIFNAAIVVYSWWVLRETSGRSLEEMETVFGSKETAFDVEATRRKAMIEAGVEEGSEGGRGERSGSDERVGGGVEGGKDEAVDASI